MASSMFLSITEVEPFKQPRQNGSSMGGFAQSVLYALVGTTLGLLTGTSVAMGPWWQDNATMRQESAAVNPPQIVASQAPTTATTNLPAAISLPQSSLPAVQHHAHKSIEISAVTVHRALARATRPAATPALSSETLVAESKPDATMASEARVTMMTIEGDLTMADYDASTGTVETREGRNFSVVQIANEAGPPGWQDYAGHVHYRCTQAGNCTLSGAGISSGARLI